MTKHSRIDITFCNAVKKEEGMMATLQIQKQRSGFAVLPEGRKLVS